MWSRDHGPSGRARGGHTICEGGIRSIFMKSHLFALFYCFVRVCWRRGRRGRPSYISLRRVCRLSRQRGSSGWGWTARLLSDRRNTIFTVAVRPGRPTWPPRQELCCFHTTVLRSDLQLYFHDWDWMSPGSGTTRPPSFVSFAAAQVPSLS